MIIYTIKTSRGGRPGTYLNLNHLLENLREKLIYMHNSGVPGKIILEVKQKGDAK